MCSIDWAALGTWAAVLVALGFFVYDKAERRLREGVEARMLAILLRPELERLDVATKAIASTLHVEGGQDDSGWLDAIAIMNPATRARLAEEFDALTIPTISSVADRVHVMREPTARAIMEVLACIEGLKLEAAVLGAMSQSQAEEMIEMFMPHLRTNVANLQGHLDAAIAECNKVQPWRKNIAVDTSHLTISD